MFRPTDPQSSLLESRFLVPPEKRARMERSWAQAFRDVVVPAIDEEVFRSCFHDSNGRPNKSIRELTGLHLLKEWDDLTDEQVLEQLEFNLLWHHALGVEPGDAHTCQKTLHNYRVMLMENERAREMFDRVTRRLIEVDGLSVSRQRLDSTHVMSNIAVLTRLGLFVETITKFMKELRRASPDRLEQLDRRYAERYLDREGYFSDAKKEQARRRLPVVASDLYRLIQRFAGDAEVRGWESYELLVRLFDEQCEVVEGPVDGEAADEPPVVVRDPDGPWETTPGSESEPVAEADQEAEDEDTGAVSGQSATPTDDDDDDSGPDVPRGGDPGASGARDSAPGEGPRGDDAAPADGAHAGECEADDASGDEADGSRVQLKEGKDISSSSLQSPHDPDATFGYKGKGYEAQVIETCDADNPYQVITGISVNGAHESDQQATVPIVEGLMAKGLRPEVLLADTGYGSGSNIVECADCDVHLHAPVQDPDAPAAEDPWLARVEEVAPSPLATSEPRGPPSGTSPGDEEKYPSDALELADFRFTPAFDKVEQCPAGRAPVEQEIGERFFQARFSGDHCRDCPMAERCPTRALVRTDDRKLYWRDVKAATATRQREQRQPEFREPYKLRSGIESTNAELKRRHGAGDLRVRGRQRVDLAMTLKALAVNTKRAVTFHTRKLAEAIAGEPAAAATMA